MSTASALEEAHAAIAGLRAMIEFAEFDLHWALYTEASKIDTALKKNAITPRKARDAASRLTHDVSVDCKDLSRLNGLVERVPKQLVRVENALRSVDPNKLETGWRARLQSIKEDGNTVSTKSLSAKAEVYAVLERKLDSLEREAGQRDIARRERYQIDIERLLQRIHRRMALIKECLLWVAAEMDRKKMWMLKGELQQFTHTYNALGDSVRDAIDDLKRHKHVTHKDAHNWLDLLSKQAEQLYRTISKTIDEAHGHQQKSLGSHLLRLGHSSVSQRTALRYDI